MQCAPHLQLAVRQGEVGVGYALELWRDFRCLLVVLAGKLPLADSAIGVPELIHQHTRHFALCTFELIRLHEVRPRIVPVPELQPRGSAVAPGTGVARVQIYGVGPRLVRGLRSDTESRLSMTLCARCQGAPPSRVMNPDAGPKRSSNLHNADQPQQRIVDAHCFKNRTVHAAYESARSQACNSTALQWRLLGRCAMPKRTAKSPPAAKAVLNAFATRASTPPRGSASAGCCSRAKHVAMPATVCLRVVRQTLAELVLAAALVASTLTA